MMNIEIKKDIELDAHQIRDILIRSTLGDRRPTDDEEVLSGMAKNSNLMVTAWKSEELVGIARCVTDFVYCCYLSDLAVDSDFQNQGIGRRLIEYVEDSIGDKCKIILLAAPKAQEYYPKIGFSKHESAWTKGKQPSGR